MPMEAEEEGVDTEEAEEVVAVAIFELSSFHRHRWTRCPGWQRQAERWEEGGEC